MDICYYLVPSSYKLLSILTDPHDEMISASVRDAVIPASLFLIIDSLILHLIIQKPFLFFTLS